MSEEKDSGFPSGDYCLKELENARLIEKAKCHGKYKIIV